MARIVFSDFREPAAAQAYDIAFDYLMRSGLAENEYQLVLFLAQSLTRMVDAGERNRIRMANRAIAEYERSRRGSVPRERQVAVPGWHGWTA